MDKEHQYLKIINLEKSFGNKKVITDINLDVNKAEVFGLLGPSGAGKTTLVKCVSGIDTATKGEVYISGEKMPKFSLMEKMGYMTQSDALYEELSGYENLSFFASIYGLKGKKKTDRINEVANLVKLQDDLKKTVVNYSGGMKRRLSLAISLLHEPDLIILDEPTVGIDPILRKSIWDELHRLSKLGKTVLVTTHVMDEAEKCDRLGMLQNGKLIAVGSPAELKDSTNSKTLEDVFLKLGGAE
ncbi:MAG: transporter related protein [Bacillales bacterium]|jgi:ABC-2 type transport system ATP-binding protein|nr:transporter related protein [Bacillales bacterium]